MSKPFMHSVGLSQKIKRTNPGGKLLEQTFYGLLFVAIAKLSINQESPPLFHFTIEIEKQRKLAKEVNVLTR